MGYILGQVQTQLRQNPGKSWKMPMQIFTVQKVYEARTGSYTAMFFVEIITIEKIFPSAESDIGASSGNTLCHQTNHKRT